jgi:hypothetical protein
MCDEWVQQRMDDVRFALPADIVQKEQLDRLEMPAHRLLNVPGVRSDSVMT